MNPKERVWVGRLTHRTAHDDFERALDNVLRPVPADVRLITIKINLCDYRRAESGATTDPVVLGAMLDVLHNRYAGARIVVFENAATSLDVWAAYRLLGFTEMANVHGAELVDVSQAEWIRKPVPHGRFFQELEVPAIVDASDLFINFAKLKTNGLTKMSGCLKNLFGVIRMKRKVILHNRVDDAIVDINKVLRPDLCVVDGVIAHEGIGGPAFGTPKRCDLLVAGLNSVAVDACCAKIMGFRPRTIRHLNLCAKCGLGPLDYHLDTELRGFSYRNYSFKFQFIEYLLRNLLRARAGVAA
jgi:uncharacterized protein (DUF362 family)